MSRTDFWSLVPQPLWNKHISSGLPMALFLIISLHLCSALSPDRSFKMWNWNTSSPHLKVVTVIRLKTMLQVLLWPMRTHATCHITVLTPPDSTFFLRWWHSSLTVPACTMGAWVWVWVLYLLLLLHEILFSLAASWLWLCFTQMFVPVLFPQSLFPTTLF